MNRRQKLIQQQFLNNEKGIIRRLDQVYEQALKDVNGNIERLMKRFDPETGDLPQSAVYQLKYQNMIKDQLEGILNELQTKQFTSVSEYLDTCYEDGFVGSLFDLHGQDVPLMMPLDQEAMVTVVQLDSKISKGLYTHLGEDVDLLKKRITAEVSRSIATGAAFADTAKQLAGKTRIGYNRAIRIARTEGHRIQNQATMNVMEQAKERGADVVKQWDATLDGKTRESHVAVDGEIREMDDRFSNDLLFPGDPAGGAEEVINCRCALLQRARWAVGDGFTKWNNFTRQLETFDSPQDYGEFKKAFFSNENKRYMNYVQRMEKKYRSRDWAMVLDRMTEREYKHYSRLLTGNPVYNKDAPSIKTITDCKTVEEVEDLIKTKGWFNVQTLNGKVYDTNESVSLQGIDLECAKSIYTTHERLFDKYPQLVGKLNSIVKADLGPMTYADCRVGVGHGGIRVNWRYYKDVAFLEKTYNRDLSEGFHPANTTWHSVVMHELGHAIDDYLSNTLHVAGMKNSYSAKYVSADMRPKIMRACKMKVVDIGKEVSEYASKDHFEWFAECFAEYMDSPNPRKVATEFGKQFEELMKGVK